MVHIYIYIDVIMNNIYCIILCDYQTVSIVAEKDVLPRVFWHENTIKSK
jgi:hypothetical protein